MTTNESKSISWSILEKVIEFYNDNIVIMIGAKEVMAMSEIEKAIPYIFKDLHDIINPSLI